MLHSSCTWIKGLCVASWWVSERRFRSSQKTVEKYLLLYRNRKKEEFLPWLHSYQGYLVWHLKMSSGICFVLYRKKAKLSWDTLPSRRKKILWNRIWFPHYENTDSNRQTWQFPSSLSYFFLVLEWERKHFLKNRKTRNFTSTGWMRKMSWNSTWCCFRIQWEKSYIWQYLLKLQDCTGIPSHFLEIRTP